MPEEQLKHPHYIEASGGIGDWDVKIFVGYSPEFDARDSSSPLLCKIGGARLQYSGEEYRRHAQVRIDFATEATDVEHDRAHLIDMILVAPHIPFGLFSNHFSIAGFASGVRIPTPEWLEEQLTSTNMCSYCTGGDQGKPHQIVEYLPPDRAVIQQLNSRMLIAEVSRRRPTEGKS